VPNWDPTQNLLPVVAIMAMWMGSLSDFSGPPGRCLEQPEPLPAPLLHVPSLMAETEAMSRTASRILKLLLLDPETLSLG